MQNLINLGQSFGSPIPGLGFPPHPGWDRGEHPLLPCEIPPDFQGGPGYSLGYPDQYYSDDSGLGSLGYNNSNNVHFSPGSCYPSPPSQTSDFPPGHSYPPPGQALSGFPSPGMEAGGPFPSD